MKPEKRVVIALSGGVDSSVAAALLVEQGFQVVGMMLRLWSEPGHEGENRCCTPDAMAMARRVAAHLDIPFYAIDAQSVFHKSVVSYFTEGYARGVTPNPCLVCNRHIRWEFLLNHARAVGADFMATGHYARLRQDETGTFQLLCAVDEAKDQSYVLHVLGQAQFQQALFPLGDYTKIQVRQMARNFGLPVAERAESQDLCFLGAEDYRAFLLRQSGSNTKPGIILHMDGHELGEHQGLALYTIGQRKGLGISSARPLYVVEKDIARNILIVGEEEFLGSDGLTASPVNWIAGYPPANPIRLAVKIRYKATRAWARVTPQGKDVAMVQFEQKVRDITPGQAAVFYDDQVCLGGGIIQNQREQL